MSTNFMHKCATKNNLKLKTIQILFEKKNIKTNYIMFQRILIFLN